MYYAGFFSSYQAGFSKLSFFFGFVCQILVRILQTLLSGGGFLSTSAKRVRVWERREGGEGGGVVVVVVLCCVVLCLVWLYAAQ